jgi:nucleotide-binding universal stress UspA family protein
MSEPRNPEAVWDRPVAVAVDGSDYAQAAADWAAGEAMRRGTPLRVLTVAEDEIDEDSLELISDTETWLTKIHSGLSVQRDALVGDPVHELETASREVATLVVGSRGLGGFAGLALGSVSMHLAARAHCPLVVVPQGHVAASHPGPTVVAVDVHECVQVLRYGLGHAERAGGGLRAVHAWTPYPAHSAMYVSDRDITARHAEEQIVEWLKAARADQYHVHPEIRVLRGRAAEVLIEQSRDADLIVAGSHRSVLPRRAVGSVLHELLMRARCPVAVVPEH